MKLTKEKIKQIKEFCKSKKRGIKALAAKKFKVHKTTIYCYTTPGYRERHNKNVIKNKKNDNKRKNSKVSK